MKNLPISRSLSLPIDAVTKTFAIIGIRNSGKTNTSVVLTEQMIRAELPVVVVDPLGVWWGLRYDASGKGPGLPVYIFGGEHADVPLEEHGGELVADFIVESRKPVILDLSRFSKSAARRFMETFAERLYQKNREALHVVIDECDLFVPQRTDHGAERLLGAIIDLVRRGRVKGLGVTLISQRPASIHKDVLTQSECMIALRLTGPHDRDALERWIEHHADPAEAKAVLASLASLPQGEGWVWSPGWLGEFKRVLFDRRTTFDSSATPKVGQKLRAPKGAAVVDLDALRVKMAETVERAKDTDPKALRARIRQLEADAQRAPVAPPTPEVRIERVEVPTPLLTSEDREAMSVLGVAMRAVVGAFDKVQGRVREIENAQNEFATGYDLKWNPSLGPSDVHVDRVPIPNFAAGYANPPAPRRAPITGDGKLGKCERTLLNVLAQRAGLTTTAVQLSVLSGYSLRSSSFQNALGKLRSTGNAEGAKDGIRITQAGVKEAGDVPPMPSGRELIAHWRGQLEKAEATLFTVLCEVYPGSLNQEQLSKRTGYSTTSSSFQNALGRLRTLELATRGWPTKASDFLFEMPAGTHRRMATAAVARA